MPPTTAAAAATPTVDARLPAFARLRQVLQRHGLVLLLLLTAATYGGLVHAGFVWDDEGLIVRNRLTGSLANIPRFFFMDLWDGAPVDQGVSGYYRPLVLISFALDRALFDLWAPGHHLHSLAWHLLAVGLLHGLLRRLLPWAPALAGAAVFALHPTQSEAVAWIAARNDPMAAALAFGALLAVAPRQAGPGRLVLGAVLALLALLSKESVVLLPAMLLILDLSQQGPGPLRRYLPLAVGIAAGLGLRAFAGVAAAALPGPVGWQLIGEQGLRVAGVYGAALSVGWPLAGTRSLEWITWEPAWRTAVGVATLALLVLAPLFLRGPRRRLALAGLAWLALTLLPTLVPVADKGVIGDRYVYVGVAGLALWLSGVAGRAMPWLVAAALLPWQGILRERLPDWANDLTLWEAALEDTGTPYTMAGLGHVWFIAGHPEIALPLFVRALDHDPPALDACDGITDAAIAVGRVEHAEHLGRWALSRGCPRTGLLAGSLSAAQAQLGLWDRAARTLEGAPPDPRGRDVVVRAALARRAGDEVAFARLLASAAQPEALTEQVARLLGSSSGSVDATLGPPAEEP